MCGICGYYQLKTIANESDLRKMNDQIIHRGPDDDGFFNYKHVGLAARRLSIIDLVTGHQPLPSDSRTSHITFNGEIYNFKELRSELIERGYSFRTKSDTEVVVNLYEEFGTDFVNKLNGMFAIGIYDKKKNKLILARDRMGINPLYYYVDPVTKNLVFGSEIKSILQYPGFQREIDRSALDYFLTLEYIPAPFSIFKGIHKLPGGHILTYSDGKLDVKEYWDVKPRKNKLDFVELKEKFQTLFKDCVHKRMISDVPLGAFLSGGVDSSAIVSQMVSNSKEKIKTFSIGFEDKSYSELKYSKIISNKFNTDHYVKKLSPDINDLVLHLADFFDEPLGDFSNFPTYLVSQTAREKVTVVLSGDGGDEIFGGYEHYIAQQISRLIDLPLIRPTHKLFSGITHLFPPSELKKGFVNRIKRFSEGLGNSYKNRHFRWMLFLSNLEKKQLYSKDYLNNEFLKILPDRDPFSKHFSRASQFEGINQDLYLDLKTYMVDNILVKVDRTSMATSLEARVPFLDHRMVEFAFSLPSSYKVKGKETKWFLKKALEGILPREIIYRQKEGFSIPIKNWLKTDLKDLMMEYLSEKRVKDSGFFNYSFITRMVNEHLSNKQNHAHRLWALILFFLWEEKFMK